MPRVWERVIPARSWIRTIPLITACWSPAMAACNNHYFIIRFAGRFIITSMIMVLVLNSSSFFMVSGSLRPPLITTTFLPCLSYPDQSEISIQHDQPIIVQHSTLSTNHKTVFNMINQSEESIHHLAEECTFQP